MTAPKKPPADPSSWRTARKALAAATGSGFTALLTGLGYGLSDGHLTRPEVAVALGLAAAAAAAVGRTVYRVPNQDA